MSYDTKILNFYKGNVIYREKEQAKYIYFIFSGEVSIS